MSTQDGQKNCPHCQAGSADAAPSAPQISQLLTPAQVQLLEYAHYLDAPDLVNSLKLLHDITIYHSHEPLDEAEKDALFTVKGLWECIERITE
ncbi:hypothetical protein [Allomuricauda sp. CP2A]|jgi:hypothetical protein|uniref:hypothetical protein n=1 Tax=Allomuricauda sp. CP2A TaxID=1848189 RepID=UPI000829641A|nr:hypothetical protein [Muricauda sp. CP2A]